MVTDTTEKALETLITKSLTGNRWLPGDPQDYDLNNRVDLRNSSKFAQQPSRNRQSRSQWTPTPQGKAVPSASGF